MPLILTILLIDQRDSSDLFMKRKGLFSLYIRAYHTNTMRTQGLKYLMLVVFRIGYSIPMFAGFIIMFLSTVSKSPGVREILRKGK